MSSGGAPGSGGAQGTLFVWASFVVTLAGVLVSLADGRASAVVFLLTVLAGGLAWIAYHGTGRMRIASGSTASVLAACSVVVIAQSAGTASQTSPFRPDEGRTVASPPLSPTTPPSVSSARVVATPWSVPTEAPTANESARTAGASPSGVPDRDEATPTSVRDRPPAELKVNADWPTAVDCDGATETAVLTGGPSPGGFKVSRDTDLREEMVESGGAAFGMGFLTLLLTTSGPDDVAQILEIVPLIHSRDLAAPAWVYRPEGGCGDVMDRVFDLDLDVDRPFLKDGGAPGNTGDPKVRGAALGHTFTVSSSDPARVVIIASACKSSAEWSLRIRYQMGGEVKELLVGSANDPFRTVTGRAPTYAIDYASLEGEGGEDKIVRRPDDSAACADAP